MNASAAAMPFKSAPSQSQLSTLKAPAHWVLARLGKRVLRPGGIRATRYLLNNLRICRTDNVVELAPGLGQTAQMILARRPASYVGIDRESPAIQKLRRLLNPPAIVIHASAEKCPLPSAFATKVVGEAMLSMHPNITKHAIVAEASRILRADGLYAIHELALTDENKTETEQKELRRNMSQVIHNGVTPLTAKEWCEVLDEHGLTAEKVCYVPFRLLNPGRLIADEGLFGATRFCFNLLRDREARQRVLSLRKTFAKYRDSLTAIVIIARKRGWD